MTEAFNFDQIKLAANFFAQAEQCNAEMPFDVFPKEPIVSDEMVTVAGFELPKIGQLVQGETFLWMHFVTQMDMESWNATVYFVGATLLLRFRHDPAWNLSKTMLLGARQLKDLYDFFKAEQAAGEAIAQADAEPEAEATGGPEAAPKAPGKSGKKRSGSSALETPDSETPDSPVAALA
jgi:hypothetical protein